MVDYVTEPLEVGTLMAGTILTACCLMALMVAIIWMVYFDD